MVMITTKEYAEIRGCSETYVNRLVRTGKIKSISTTTDKNVKKNLIPLDQFTDDIKLQYYKSNNIISTDLVVDDISQFESLSMEEREECSFWIKIIEEWQSYRNKAGFGKKIEVDELFIAKMKLEYPDINISYNILNRKWSYYCKKDFKAMVDKRGKVRKGKTKIDDYTWKVFCSFYLNQAKHSIKKSFEYTEDYLKENRPELLADMPCYETFTRHKKDIPEAITVLSREGEKAFDDKCGPYISRDYTNMHSNQYWVGDTHTIDVMVGDGQKTFRIYLAAYMDARSGIFTGFNLATSSNSQSSIIALRRGIMKYGIPENLYLDNGREFLTFDFGGLGHRAKRNDNHFNPETILERLGIKMTNALVRNARAKTIERRFLDFKNSVSRLFATYTGGNVVEKPEILKKELKNGNIPNIDEFINLVTELIEYDLNYEEYNGPVLADKGKKKIEVYNNNKTHEIRVASEEQLNLLMMRSTRAQKVKRNGVYLNINDVKYEFFNPEMTTQLFGKQVYLRYDPQDLSKVRIYDLEDRFIMEAESKIKLPYGADIKDVKKAIAEDRKVKKMVKEIKDNAILQEIDRNTALELMLKKAQENKMLELEKPDIKQTTLVSEEEPMLHQFVVPDLNKMNENALKRKGGKEYA